MWTAWEGGVALLHGRDGRLAADDTVTHAPRADIDGDPVRASAARATVAGEAPAERGLGGRVGWIREVARDEATEAPARPVPADRRLVEALRDRGVGLGELSFALGDRERVAPAAGLRAG